MGEENNVEKMRPQKDFETKLLNEINHLKKNCFRLHKFFYFNYFYAPLNRHLSTYLVLIRYKNEKIFN